MMYVLLNIDEVTIIYDILHTADGVMCVSQDTEDKIRAKCSPVQQRASCHGYGARQGVGRGITRDFATRARCRMGDGLGEPNQDPHYNFTK